MTQNELPPSIRLRAAEIPRQPPVPQILSDLSPRHIATQRLFRIVLNISELSFLNTAVEKSVKDFFPVVNFIFLLMKLLDGRSRRKVAVRKACA